ncbi:MAG TPA: rod shape-determining protein MreD [Bacteroidales bacterium]|nr:rod shape-determining protein MreD [Bacteroidales bacterium]
MIRLFLKHLFLFVLLLLLQIIVFQQLYFWYVTPLVYVYILIRWPATLPAGWVLILGFLLGLLVDVNVDTPGMHAAATTFVAFLRPSLLKGFLNRDEVENLEPREKSMGFLPYWKYAASIVLLHHTALYVLESFSFFDPLLLLVKIVGSALLSLLLIFLFERF